MLSERLEKLGLGKNEAIIYAEISRLGSSPVAKIMENTGIHPHLAYRSLDNLVLKGLVAETFRDHKKFYALADPHKLVRDVEHKLELAHDVERDIKALASKAAESQKVTIFQGEKAVVMARKFIIDSINDGGRYYILNANITKFLEAMGGEFERQERELVRRKITQEFVAYEEQKAELEEIGRKRYFKSVKREYFFIDDTATIPMSVDFSEKRVAILVFGIEPLAIGIVDPILAAGYKKIFETLKKNANGQNQE